jgi:small subunit ribosomal protein S16
MAVKIRLARIGKKSEPFYRIVAIDSRAARDAATLEILGTYDATKKKFEKFHDDRIEAWIQTGAQMTDSVKKLRKMYHQSNVA